MDRNALLVLGALAALSIPCRAGGGASAAQFLKLGVSARAMAMGEAFTAAADDATALYWNPSGLTRIKSRSASLMHVAYLNDSFLDYGAYAQKAGKTWALGAGVQYFSSGKITTTDLLGNDTGSFTPSDMAVSLGAARQFNSFALGAAVKYVRSKIVDSASTVTGDFGILSQPFFHKKIRLGAAAANLRGEIKYGEESEPMPRLFRAGASFRVKKQLGVTADAVIDEDSDLAGALGVEYMLALGERYRAALRAGYNSRTADDIDGFTGFSAGLGFSMANGWGLDYAMVAFGDVGLSHRFSVGVKF